MPSLIEKLKALEAAATPGPWVHGGHGDPIMPHGFRKPLIFERNFGDVPIQSTEYHSNLLLTETLRNLAPELIALWSAVQQHENERFDLIEEALNALEALNAKAKEVLK